MEIVKKLDKGMESKEYFCTICQETHEGVPPTKIISMDGTKSFYICNNYLVMLRNKRGKYNGTQGYDGSATIFVP
jgi:hypothetical protein